MYIYIYIMFKRSDNETWCFEVPKLNNWGIFVTPNSSLRHDYRRKTRHAVNDAGILKVLTKMRCLQIPRFVAANSCFNFSLGNDTAYGNDTLWWNNTLTNGTANFTSGCNVTQGSTAFTCLSGSDLPQSAALKTSVIAWWETTELNCNTTGVTPFAWT